MNKKGNMTMIVLGIVAIIAVIGLVLLFKGGTGGKATGAVTADPGAPCGTFFAGAFPCPPVNDLLFNGPPIRFVGIDSVSGEQCCIVPRQLLVG